MLLEQAQSKVDARTSSLREAEAELQTLLASKDATDAEKSPLQTRRRVDAIQKSSETKRAHILVLNQERTRSSNSHTWELENDIAGLPEKRSCRDRQCPWTLCARPAMGDHGRL